MILLFGGTTEGKQAAEILDYLKLHYYYSTKNKVTYQTGGVHIAGTMNAAAISAFCKENQIRLIVDAAHPFARQLHRNISEAAREQSVETIRFDRPDVVAGPRDNVRYFSDFDELEAAVRSEGYHNILALTGVQTIPKLQLLWQERNCYFRILDTALSCQKAEESGIPRHFIFSKKPENNPAGIIELAQNLNIEVILTKESGASGFFESKLEAACTLGLPLWVVKRPGLPEYSFTVNQSKELLRILLKLRKDLLKDKEELRSGYTTGTCVTAAVKACFMALSEGYFPKRTEVKLPGDVVASLMIFDGKKNGSSARCVVIKDGGDDPDVTHGHEIGCELRISSTPGICFLKGEGVGMVTLPGLQVTVGEPAINPVPRQMITMLLASLSEEYEIECNFDVIPFVPEGEMLGKKTFNPRVGVEGGISIIGTSGIVHPYSNEAFLASLKQQMSVAAQTGLGEVVLTSGKRSENMVRESFSHLPDTAFIHFGNLVGDSLKLTEASGIRKVTLVIMFGKGVKLAAGHLNTHSKEVTFDASFLARIARDCCYGNDIVQKVESVKLANAVLEIIPFSAKNSFYRTIARMCFSVAGKNAATRIDFSLILLSGKGQKIEISNIDTSKTW
jgi:cobalt-precorrin-5B (C1)-methyltransferase